VIQTDWVFKTDSVILNFVIGQFEILHTQNFGHRNLDRKKTPPVAGLFFARHFLVAGSADRNVRATRSEA
jgi:hypothetical protein